MSFTDRTIQDAPDEWLNRPDDDVTPALQRLSEAARAFPEVEHLSAFELADGTVGI